MRHSITSYPRLLCVYSSRWLNGLLFPVTRGMFSVRVNLLGLCIFVCQLLFRVLGERFLLRPPDLWFCVLGCMSLQFVGCTQHSLHSSAWLVLSIQSIKCYLLRLKYLFCLLGNCTFGLFGACV